MKANQTIISVKEMRTFYKEECKNEERKFSEKEFDEFIACLDSDKYECLKENANFFSRQKIDEKIIKEEANLLSALKTLSEIQKQSTRTKKELVKLLQNGLDNSSLGLVLYEQLIKSKNKFGRVRRNATINIGGSFGGQIPTIDIFFYNTQKFNILAFVIVNQYSQNIADALFQIKKELLKSELMKHIRVFYAVPFTKNIISKKDIVIFEITESYAASFDLLKKQNKKSITDLHNLLCNQT